MICPVEWIWLCFSFWVLKKGAPDKGLLISNGTVGAAEVGVAHQEPPPGPPPSGQIIIAQ